MEKYTTAKDRLTEEKKSESSKKTNIFFLRLKLCDPCDHMKIFRMFSAEKMQNITGEFHQ